MALLAFLGEVSSLALDKRQACSVYCSDMELYIGDAFSGALPLTADGSTAPVADANFNTLVNGYCVLYDSDVYSKQCEVCSGATPQQLVDAIVWSNICVSSVGTKKKKKKNPFMSC